MPRFLVLIIYLINSYIAALFDWKKIIIAKGKVQKKESHTKKKSEKNKRQKVQKKDASRKKISEVLASFWVLMLSCIILLAWTRSRTSLGQRQTSFGLLFNLAISELNYCYSLQSYFKPPKLHIYTSDQYRKISLQSWWHRLTGITNPPPVVPSTALLW